MLRFLVGSLWLFEKELFVFHGNEDYTRGQDACNITPAVLMWNTQGDIIILNKIQVQNFQKCRFHDFSAIGYI